MQLLDFAGAMGRGQALVPDWAQEELERKLGALKTRAFSLDNQQAEQRIANTDAATAAGVEATTRARTRERQMAADLAAYHANPTSDASVRMMTTYPEMREPMKEAWDLRSRDTQQQDLKFFTNIKFALANGRPDLAERVIQRVIDAGGDDLDDDREMLEMIRTDPARAAANLDGILAAIAGPEKMGDAAKALGDMTKTLGENRRADELQPGLVRKGSADALSAETTATYAPQVIESGLANDEANRRNLDSQIATRSAQLEIARDTLESNVNLKLEEYAQAGLKPDPGSVKMMNDAVVAGSANASLAEQTRGLADQFAASPVRGGFYSGMAETAKNVFGGQDGVSVLRGRYQQLINSAAIKSLPPGPASDKDIQIARQGFPSPTAPREYIVSWLRGMAKMQDAAAGWDNSRADWIAGNGNLGPAKRDLLVNGVRVPQGTNFGSYQRRSTATTNRQALPDRSYMQFAR